MLTIIHDHSFGLRRFGALGLLLGLAACGDLTGAEGDAGLLRFVLVTDYEVPETSLRDATLVAGHMQRIDVDLTAEGAEEIRDPARLTYRAPAAATLELASGSGSDGPDLSLLVDDPGDVRIEALIDGEVVDGIDLAFDVVASLELSVRVRAPWGEDFDEVDNGASTTVTEGSHATFLPIPLAADGERLAGDIETDVKVDPAWSVVPGEDVLALYEDGSWTSSGAIDFYFIEPTEATVTITETSSGGGGQHTFVVEPVEKD